MIKEKTIRQSVDSQMNQQKLYRMLSAPEYSVYPYDKVNLGEEMTLLKEVIGGYWKPRYLMDHVKHCAYEFMTSYECLTAVEDDDILWNTLNGLPDKAWQRAREKSLHYPSDIYGYSNGVAKVCWQLVPDGYYFRDEDGFGMTDDDEINIYGFIDRQGRVVVPFRYIRNSSELVGLRTEAEQIVSAR